MRFLRTPFTGSATRVGRTASLLSLAARVTAGVVVARRLLHVRRAAAPVTVDAPPVLGGLSEAWVKRDGRGSIAVVIPARDEAERIGPLLDAVVGAPFVDEVIVVDDRSSDDTARIARDAGALVVVGDPLPEGWAGKAWALDQGIRAASADWIVTFDADARPDPRLPGALVDRARDDELDLVTAGGRFQCPTGPARWLHAAMLTTLVYRFGPPGVSSAPHRMMANGQCMVFRRRWIVSRCGLEPVRGEVVEDVALARHHATAGASVAFLDATDLLAVRMFESVDDVWHGWGRSLSLPGVDTRLRRSLDAATVLLAQALPLPRLLVGRGDPVDVVLLALRLGTLAGTRTAYDRNDLAYWASPLADLLAAGALARGVAARGPHVWRGRSYQV